MKAILGLTVTLALFACQKRVEEQPKPVAVAVKPVSPPAPPDPPPPPSDSGVWIESDAYKLKLVSSTRCAKGRLGFRVRIGSKVKALYVGPRDATLLDGDQRYDALRTPDFDGCKPALANGHLQRGKETEGYLVFEVGSEPKEPVLEFAPTRWGGIGTVRVAVKD